MRSRRIAILALTLCLGALPLAGQAQEAPETQRQSLGRQQLDRIVAVVNEGAIMATQLENRLAQARQQLTGRDVSLPPEETLRRQVLERMIVEEIQLQMAREANLNVDDTELNRQVRAIAESNGMSLEQFADALEADGLSLEVVREQIRRELLIRQLQQRQVAGRVTISEREVDRYLEQQEAGASRDQARQALFQRKANDELDAWLQEIRAAAFVDIRLESS